MATIRVASYPPYIPSEGLPLAEEHTVELYPLVKQLTLDGYTSHANSEPTDIN